MGTVSKQRSTNKNYQENISKRQPVQKQNTREKEIMLIKSHDCQ